MEQMVRETPGITVFELLVYFILRVIKFQIHNKLFWKSCKKKLHPERIQTKKNFTEPHWSYGWNRELYSDETDRLFS